MARRWGVVAVSIAALVAWARPGSSQPVAEEAAPTAPASAAYETDATESRKQAAKERFLRGLELAKAGSWDAALAEFLASRELFPTRVALKNAAISLRNLRRYAEALVMYQELVAKFGDKTVPSERKQIDEAMAELGAMVAEIDVEGAAPGSLVVVDGQQRGTTPLPSPISVNAGTHSVRVSKEGFEPFETQLTIAGKQRKTVRAPLRLLAASGRLVVSEADGGALDVLLDGAVVGKTPWQGSVGVGPHSVALRGAGNLGTQPVTATVRPNQVATLSLRATKLDAELRVEPTPANARVDLDGVNVGTGVWQGRLTSGQHRLEVYALGHIPYRQKIAVHSGERELVRVALERDLSNPLWKVGFRQHLYFEAMVGGAFGPSLGGGADDACSANGCSARSRPLGFFAAARGGYQLTTGLGAELLLGYVRLSESMTRTQTAVFDISNPVTSTNYEDTTLFSAPLALLSASYELFETTPLVFRLGGGVARAHVRTTNQGTFSGNLDGSPVNLNSSIPEQAQSLWVPVAAPEVRFGYRVSKRVAVNFGVAAFVFFGPPSPRTDTDTSGFSPDEGQRVDTSSAGALELPEEDAIGTFFAIVPTLGCRVDL